MINLKFSVDQINGSVCILEEVNTGNIIQINIESLPEGIVEGNIVVLKDGVYELDIVDEGKRRLSLRERMNKLKKTNE